MNIGIFFYVGDESFFDFGSRAVADESNSVEAVAAFAGKLESAFFLFKRDAESEQTVDGLRGMRDHEAHGAAVVVVGAGGKSVLDVFFDVVGLAEDCGDAALRVVGIGVEEVFFCDQQDLAFLGCVQGKVEAGDAGADDEKIGVHGAILDRLGRRGN